MAFTFKFFTEVLFLSIILCLANTGIVNVLVSTLYSKPDEVTGYECGLYSTKGGRLKDRISFYTVGLTMMIFDVEVMKAKVNRLRLSVRSYINPTEQNKPLELKPWASDVTRDPCKP